MPDEILSVKDILASVTADVDQAQAMIDEARLRFPNEIAFQQQLDVAQFKLDTKRERIKLMRFIDDNLEP